MCVCVCVCVCIITQFKQVLFKTQNFDLPPSSGDFGEGNGTPLQYSCLENPMDGGAWWGAVNGVTESWIQLSDFTFTFHFSLSCTGEGNGNPLQCSCLENPLDRGDWQATVHGVSKSDHN